MNMREAIEALLDGKKVSKINWNTGTYISLKDGLIVDENENNYSLWFEGEWEVYKEQPKKIEITDSSFGSALNLLISGVVKKIGCWHRDNTYVYLDQLNGQPFLFVHTINGEVVPWVPNNREMLISLWRVIE